MNEQKETAPAVQAEAVNGKDSAHVSANDDRQPAASSQAASSVDKAIALSRDGRSAIPVGTSGPKAKQPLVEWHGFQRLVPDKPLIEGWFKRNPNAGVAQIMGRGLFALDIDCKNGQPGFDSLQQLQRNHGDLPQTYTVTTPSGGRHFYFRAPDGIRTRCGTGMLPGIDVRGDGGYVVCPPTVLDSGAYVVEDDAPCAMAPDWLLALVRADRERPAQGSVVTGASTAVTQQQIADLSGALHFHDPDDYSAWINAGMALHELGDVGWNLWLEFSSRYSGFSIEEAREKWATFQPSDTGFPSIFKTAQSNGWRNPAGKGAAFAPSIEDEGPDGGFIWGDALTSPERMKPMDWTVRKLIPSECTGLLFGAWGTCKTFVALDLACCIANGAPWHGHSTKKGTVFYLCGEGETGIAYRLKAWQNENGGSTAGVAVKGMPDIRDAATLDHLMQSIERLAAERGEPRMILLDTLFTALNGGDENSGKDMGVVFRAMRTLRARFNCAVIAIHHTGHDGDRARGHSSMPAGVDVQFYLKAKDGPEGAIFLEMENTKQKDGSKRPTIHLVCPVVTLPELKDDEGEAATSRVIQLPGAGLLEQVESTWQLASEGGKAANKAQNAAMRQLAVDLYAADHSLQKISEIVAEQFGESKNKTTIRTWLQKAGVYRGREG